MRDCVAEGGEWVLPKRGKAMESMSEKVKIALSEKESETVGGFEVSRRRFEELTAHVR